MNPGSSCIAAAKAEWLRRCAVRTRMWPPWPVNIQYNIKNRETEKGRWKVLLRWSAEVSRDRILEGVEKQREQLWLRQIM